MFPTVLDLLQILSLPIKHIDGLVASGNVPFTLDSPSLQGTPTSKPFNPPLLFKRLGWKCVSIQHFPVQNMLHCITFCVPRQNSFICVFYFSFSMIGYISHNCNQLSHGANLVSEDIRYIFLAMAQNDQSEMEFSFKTSTTIQDAIFHQCSWSLLHILNPHFIGITQKNQ